MVDLNSFLNCLSRPKVEKETELKIRFSSFGVKEKEKKDFLKEGNMFGKTVLLFIIIQPFLMRQSVKEMRNKADEVFEMTIDSYASQESKWKSKNQIRHFPPGRIHILSHRCIQIP